MRGPCTWRKKQSGGGCCSIVTGRPDLSLAFLLSKVPAGVLNHSESAYKELKDSVGVHLAAEALMAGITRSSKSRARD